MDGVLAVVDLDEFKQSLSGEHVQALEWFDRHQSLTVSWTVIKGYVEKGARLVNQAKGIYKPAYTDCTLSVRQTLNSPYSDKEVIHRSDGSWLYPYYQENPDPSKRDREATNRGLVKCMENHVPVGVLIQTKPKPGVEYKILGLARVIDWRDGYFFLEGYSKSGGVSAKSGLHDAGLDRARAETIILPTPDFDPSQQADQRARTIAKIVQRRGQAKFRKALLEAYDGKCAVTGCDAVEALEAAHITPYLGEHTNHPQNGLLLRADVHSLFDLGLIAVDPETMKVVLANDLLSSSYLKLQGRRITQVIDETTAPSIAALQQHFKWSGIGILERTNEDSG
jgi:putative restriction endonuclease